MRLIAPLVGKSGSWLELQGRIPFMRSRKIALMRFIGAIQRPSPETLQPTATARE
jgi:hypothetical protein